MKCEENNCNLDLSKMVKSISFARMKTDEELNQDLKDAVDSENYEQAVKIRDKHLDAIIDPDSIIEIQLKK